MRGTPWSSQPGTAAGSSYSGLSHRYSEFCPGHGADIVPLLEVDDLDQARAELVRGGAELLGGPESDGAWI